MTLVMRKLVVLVLIASVFLLANAVLVVDWLSERGVIDLANRIRTEYLTGTAIAIIVVLLVLLVGSRSAAGRFSRRCPVCDHLVAGRARYCGQCGSRV
jgi:hypothetical protein